MATVPFNTAINSSRLVSPIKQHSPIDPEGVVGTTSNFVSVARLFVKAADDPIRRLNAVITLVFECVNLHT